MRPLNSPDAQELYSFLPGLDVMRAAFEKDTTAVLSTNSDLGHFTEIDGRKSWHAQTDEQ